VKRWFRLFAAAVVVVSCKPDPEHYDPHCEDYPDFVVTIHAANGLPRDTQVEVNYGGTLQELYRLRDHAAHHVLFCDPDGSEGGAGGASSAAEGGGTSSSSLDSVRCELWTLGPAEVNVSGSGYRELSEMLAPDTERQCTVSRVFELERSQ
jgi:hypothetical protein